MKARDEIARELHVRFHGCDEWTLLGPYPRKGFHCQADYVLSLLRQRTEECAEVISSRIAEVRKLADPYSAGIIRDSYIQSAAWLEGAKTNVLALNRAEPVWCPCIAWVGGTEIQSHWQYDTASSTDKVPVDARFCQYCGKPRPAQES